MPNFKKNVHIESNNKNGNNKQLRNTEQPETKRSDRTLAKRVRDGKYYQKVFLSLSVFFLFCLFMCYVNLRGGGFLFSILVEIYDNFVE